MKTLKARLGMICALLATALIIVGITGYVSLLSVAETYDHVATINLPNATLLEQMSTARGNSIRQIVRLGYPNIDQGEMKKLITRFDEFKGTYETADKQYQSVPFVDGESAIYDQVSDNWKKTVASAQQMMTLREKGDLEPTTSCSMGISVPITMPTARLWIV